ncbi:hypothetical protein [Nocardia vaccinii]|uniref:hypothetical protein n=1 Tax=Nocardia vaccinii TaxID=1822 RepID=UPI000829B30E|nr:hypothetical protein [Nocardia vaccinii]
MPKNTGKTAVPTTAVAEDLAAPIATMSVGDLVRPQTGEALSIFAVGFGGAAAVMAAAPKPVAATMSWGPGAGWMREIVIWNLGTLVGLVGARNADEEVKRGLVRGYTVTSALFAINHFASALRSPRAVGHWATGLMNVGAVVTGVAALTRSK